MLPLYQPLKKLATIAIPALIQTCPTVTYSQLQRL
jgi:hypothetical protein